MLIEYEKSTPINVPILKLYTPMPIILIAPDSYKESLSAQEVAHTIATQWQQTRPHDTLLIHPMADGGEGTMEAILSVLGGEKRTATVTNPMGQPIQAQWGWLAESQTAVIEMATASGLHLVPPAQRNVLTASTYGTGELITAALDAGAQSIILTIGGSATNDAGTGMLTALGARFLDQNDQPIATGGAALAQIKHISLTDFDPRLKQTKFVVACDVDNPLCGVRGASAIFGPQKGATPENIPLLDQALLHFANLCQQTLGSDLKEAAGAGAAGGMGFAALTFFNAQFRAGIELVAETTHLKQSILQADLVITGEGRLDAQTLHGKTIMGIIKLTAQNKKPIIALAGHLAEGYQDLYPHGLTAAFSIAHGPMSLHDSQANAPKLLQELTHNVARFYSQMLD